MSAPAGGVPRWPRPVVGAVLVGGASRRMGRDKAVIGVQGRPMAAWVVRAMRAAGVEEVVLVGGDPTWARELATGHVADRWPGEGPLGGLATALADGPAAAGFTPGAAALVVVAACDQPSLDAIALVSLIEAVDDAGPDGPVRASAPHTGDGRLQPFPSVWEAVVADRLVALVETGARRADAAFEVVDIAPVEVQDRAVADVDTPADLAGLNALDERTARRRSRQERTGEHG